MNLRVNKWMALCVVAGVASLPPRADAAVVALTNTVTQTSSRIFSLVTPGTLGFNAARTYMGTENVSGGSRAKFQFSVVGASVTLTASSPTVMRDTTSETSNVANPVVNLYTVATGGTSALASTNATGISVPASVTTYYVSFDLNRSNGNSWGDPGVITASTTITCV